MPKKSNEAPEATTNTGPGAATTTRGGEPAPGPKPAPSPGPALGPDAAAVPALAPAGDPSTVATPPPEVSAAASALGKRARGVPKTLTPERREELREAAAHARGFRRVSGQVAPAQGRRVRGVPVPVAPAPVSPAVGRRVSAKIVLPTQSDVDAFGRGR